MNHEEFEYLIIGGGVIGLSLAYELSRRGATRIAVVDRQQAGREASWAGAGILPPARQAAATHPLEHLRGLSCELHAVWARQLLADTGIDTGFRRCGGLHVAHTFGEQAALSAWSAHCRDEQIAVSEPSRLELSRSYPALCLDSLKSWLYLPEEAQLRNPRHLRALLVACRQAGVTVHEHQPVESWESTGRRISGVRTSQGLLRSQKYCLTAGAWAQPLLAKAGFASGLLPVRGQMLLYELDKPPMPCIINEGSRYVVPREDGRLLVGSTEEEVGFDKGTTHDARASLIGFAERLLPLLSQHTPAAQWAGLRPASFDGLPYLGRLPGKENMFVATGHFRCGLSLSTGTAAVMASLMMDQPTPVELDLFRVDRLAVSP